MPISGTIPCEKAKQFNEHKRKLFHRLQRVLAGYGVFVIIMVFVACVWKVKSSWLTQKHLNHSRKSCRMSWNARASHLSKSTIVMKLGYIIWRIMKTRMNLSTISSGQAANMLEHCLTWYERQDEATASSLLLLMKIRDLAASKRFENLSYFNRNDGIRFLCKVL